VVLAAADGMSAESTHGLTATESRRSKRAAAFAFLDYFAFEREIM
jgi:hypothetical protein